jgi:hypothetical protein
MLKQRNVVILSVLVLSLFLLAACGGGGSSGSPNSGNLTVWGMGAEGDSLKVLANDFIKPPRKTLCFSGRDRRGVPFKAAWVGGNA